MGVVPVLAYVGAGNQFCKTNSPLHKAAAKKAFSSEVVDFVDPKNGSWNSV
jgi:hypothetical protein